MTATVLMTDFPAFSDTEVSRKKARPRPEQNVAGEASFSTDACLEAILGGDPEAAEQLMKHLYPVVTRIIRGRLSRQLAEEDVTQEIFVKLFRKLHQYRGEVPIEHWASRIAVTTCLNAMRGQRLRVELRRADLSEAEDEALERTHRAEVEINPADALASRELLGKLLDLLSPRDRLLIEMLELEGHTSEEAARLLGISAVAVRVRALRARRRLRIHLKHLLKEERP